MLKSTRNPTSPVFAQSQQSKVVSVTRAVGLVLALGAPAVLAQQQPDGQSIKLGNADLYPAVRIDYIQNSNAFLSPQEPTDTTAFQIRPEATWVAQRRLLKLQASYNGIYQAASEDVINYTDHILNAGVDAQLDKRRRASASVSIEFGHQDLGTGLTRNITDADAEQVEYVDTDLNAEFGYGARGAKGNAAFGINIENFAFSNRRDLTQGRDESSVEPYGIFSYRLGADTRAEIELRYRTVDSNQDRNDLSLLAGLEFAATGKSGGSISFGTTQSSFKAAGVDDSSNFVIEGSLFWEPSKFSRFTLDLNRSLDGTAGDLVASDVATPVTDRVAVNWNYNWSSRLSHRATASLSAINVDCPSRGSRTTDVGLELNLKVRRWLSVGLRGSSVNRVLDECSAVADDDLDYEQTNAGVYLRATL